jgi:phosphoribosylformylglycinamidine cyclo-ligase
VFEWLQRAGRVEDAEMLRVFNCGIGMALVLSAQQAVSASALLAAAGETVYTIGLIRARTTDGAQTVVR